MKRLGRRQIARLADFRARHIPVVLAREDRRLIELGLLVEGQPGGYPGLTPAGLRALAGLIEEGSIPDHVFFVTAALERLRSEAG